jgi:DNA-binding NarL/FixJ family response regulator
VARPDSADFTRRALLASPGATIVFFGVEEPRNAAAAIAAGARGVIRADHTDAVTLVTKAVLLLLTQPAVSHRPVAMNGNGHGLASRPALAGGGPGCTTPPGRGLAAVGAPWTTAPLRTATALPNQRADVLTEPPRRRVELTERELQVLRGMADGKSNAEIGRDLFVSEDTVKTHARRLFRKLGARDRAHAVASAFRAGLVS